MSVTATRSNRPGAGRFLLPTSANRISGRVGSDVLPGNARPSLRWLSHLWLKVWAPMTRSATSSPPVASVSRPSRPECRTPAAGAGVRTMPRRGRDARRYEHRLLHPAGTRLPLFRGHLWRLCRSATARRVGYSGRFDLCGASTQAKALVGRPEPEQSPPAECALTATGTRPPTNWIQLIGSCSRLSPGRFRHHHTDPEEFS
jgi:hypothetical protein